MSDDRRDGPRWSVILPVTVVVALLVVGALLFRPDDAARPASEPSPTPPAPTEAPSEPPPFEGSEPPTPAPRNTVTEPAMLPGPEDVERYIDSNGPADHTATGDVISGDTTDEVVIAWVRNDTSHILVGTWNGLAYETVFEDDGASADRVDGLDLQDYNGEPGAEIVTLESVGEAGASLSIWGFDGKEIARQVAEGGCWDGFHHFGITGATIEPGEIVATCDGSPVGGEEAPSDVYEWTGGAWTHVRTTGKTP